MYGIQDAGPSKNNMLRVDDLRIRLGIGRNRAYQLLRSEGFPSIQIGRSYMVSEKNLQSWLDQHTGKTVTF